MPETLEKKRVQIGVRMTEALKSRIEAAAAAESRTPSDWARLVLEERIGSGIPAGRDGAALSDLQRLALDALESLPASTVVVLARLAQKAGHDARTSELLRDLEALLPAPAAARIRTGGSRKHANHGKGKR